MYEINVNVYVPFSSSWVAVIVFPLLHFLIPHHGHQLSSFPWACPCPCFFLYLCLCPYLFLSLCPCLCFSPYLCPLICVLTYRFCPCLYPCPGLFPSPFHDLYHDPSPFLYFFPYDGLYLFLYFDNLH